jgi:hypothetical protein
VRFAQENDLASKWCERAFEIVSGAVVADDHLKRPHSLTGERGQSVTDYVGDLIRRDDDRERGR